MTNAINTQIDRVTLEAHIEELLAELGTGRMDSVAYDTAWLARLAIKYPGQGFDGALDWLRAHQHVDGSWGSTIKHYHDRTISTLAAIVALQESGNTHDQKRIQRGMRYLWSIYGYVYMDANDTTNFKGLVTLLTEDALGLGLDVPPYEFHNYASNQKKLEALRKHPQKRHPLLHSSEFLRLNLTEGSEFIESNGSIAMSPSATASMLVNSQQTDPRLLYYLRQTVQTDGGAPDFCPIDTFEILWTLGSLRSSNIIKPTHPQVKRCLDFLYKTWSPTAGLGGSQFWPVTDGDDTALGFALLRWGEYPVKADVFATYEEADHFRCYANEADISLSVQVRTLAALQAATDHARYDIWREKLVNTLQNRTKNSLWFDKWHSSAYYLSHAVVTGLHGICDDLVSLQAQWIINTQNEDGGWGYHDGSTPEETAYGLQALLIYSQFVGHVEHDCLDQAAHYLFNHVNDTAYVPLWLGKGLYTPPTVVRSTILAALHYYISY